MDAELSADEGGQSSTSEGEPPEPGPEDRVTIRMATTTASIDADWVVSRLESVLEILGNEGAVAIGRVAIRVVDDAEMDRLHQRHSGIAGTTDVLTFVEEEPGGLGVDLVACIDEAHRRADDLGHDASREILLYAVHGVLHGLGHDDHDPDAHARMHAEEDRLLELVGVGPVYGRGGDA